MYRLLKIGHSLAYLWLIVLTWRFAHHHVFDGQFATGCAVISGLWLTITLIEMHQYLRTYFDSVSRLALVIPTMLGATLATLAFLTTTVGPLRLGATALLAGWILVFVKYQSDKREYLTEGKQRWLPKGAWLNPPAEAMQPGDLILTYGRFAKAAGDPLGHGEKVVRDPDGKLWALSSYMQEGVVLQPLEKVANARASAGMYVVLRLVEPLSEKKIQVGWEIANFMLEENDRWRKKKQAERDRLFDRLARFLPQSLIIRLRKKFRVTGYDWAGLFIGAQSQAHWTCIACCEEWDQRLSLPTKKQGTGLLGFGTGLFDPIMPVRCLEDEAYHLLITPDRTRFEASGTTTANPEK
jgi:hypothetical protein